jgi:uncharacterized protein YndB with AHSA1/START domain
MGARDERTRTMTGVVATAEVDINAGAQQVWSALTDPKKIAKYMMGAEVSTDWRPGSAITWKGEYQGRSYEDKGEVVEFRPAKRLMVTHFSPLSGQPDEPSNYHTVVYDLAERDGKTHLSLSQDNNASEEEAQHSASNWQMMLDGLKNVVEGSPRSKSPGTRAR